MKSRVLSKPGLPHLQTLKSTKLEAQPAAQASLLLHLRPQLTWGQVTGQAGGSQMQREPRPDSFSHGLIPTEPNVLLARHRLGAL